MAIDEISIIDFVSCDSDKQVVLTIADHLEWEDEHRHLSLLQLKVNTYCTYVESGQLYQDYPETRDLGVHISVVFVHDPPQAALDFLHYAEGALSKDGFVLEWKMLGK
jgi:hypothetical protein